MEHNTNHRHHRLCELWQHAHAASATAIDAAARNGVDPAVCAAARERLSVEKSQVAALLAQTD